MSPHDSEPEPEPEPLPPIADFAQELAKALQGVEDAFEKLHGNDHIAASLLVHLAARLWTDAGAEPDTFVALCQTLIKLEAEARRT